MGNDHRIIGAGGVPIPFTCANRGYRTNTQKGCPHGTLSAVQGSVLSKALIESPDCSLWLEHVTEKTTQVELYWLIWYDSSGLPLVPMSAVFGKDGLRQMVSLLTEFVP